MSDLPADIKLTLHAKERLEERNKICKQYDIENLMKSSCRWYGINDLIPQSALYVHALYVCRKAKDKMKYITDGNIEVLYDKNVGVAITIMEVKEKFLPITQYIKPEVLGEFEEKERNRKMRDNLGECPDCGRKDVELVQAGMYTGLCDICRRRKQNMKARGKEYVPYLKLSEVERKRVDALQRGQVSRKVKQETLVMPELPKKIPVIENYYQVKAEQNPTIAHVIEKPVINQTVKSALDPLSDQTSFVKILRDCNCEIPEKNLNEVLNILMATDKLKDILITIAKNDNQDAILDLEQVLNVAERKLQHNWEYNGFQEIDDIKFKGFLTWRRVLKGAIFFWKKLYQTNTIIEMQRAWNSYTQDPNDKIVLAGDKVDSSLKRYQITTESISTIFNTRKPFTRVFYATDKDTAYDMFKKWMADRNLHEDPKKTTIVELKNDSSKNSCGKDDK